jgi:hypothetical protein
MAERRLTKDDLPCVHVSPLRKSGVIKAGMDSVQITYGEGEHALKRTVKLSHSVFPQHGGWSYFVCPECGHRARRLRLLEGKPMCWRCDGLRYRAGTRDPGWLAERERRLEEQLKTAKQTRKLTIALRRVRIMAERRGLARARKAIAKPQKDRH